MVITTHRSATVVYIIPIGDPAQSGRRQSRNEDRLTSSPGTSGRSPPRGFELVVLVNAPMY
jgi:hypothetical protein